MYGEVWSWSDIFLRCVPLAVRYPKSVDDTVKPCTQTDCPYTEGLAVGYRALTTKDVAFPFGHGLSYTEFAYKMDTVTITARGGDNGTAGEGGSSGGSCSAHARACFTVSVTNIGKVAGADVPQVYVKFPSSAGEPGTPLRGFQKTAVLAPGASAQVVFELTDVDLSIWDLSTDGFTLATGNFLARIGASSRDIRLNYAFTV